jgi:hypothetical protein
MPNAAPDKRSAHCWKAVAILAASGWVALCGVSRSAYVVAAPFGLLSMLIAATNLHWVALGLRGKKAPSKVPIVGGFLGLIVVQIGFVSGQWPAWPALILVLVDPMVLLLPLLLWDRFTKHR